MDNKIISVMSQGMITITTYFLFFMFFKDTYSPRYKTKLVYIGVFIGEVATGIIVNCFNQPFINLAFTFIVSNLVCIKLFRCNLRKVWLYNSLFLLLMLFTDTFTVLLWTAIRKQTLNDVLGNYEQMVLSNLLNILLMFLAYRIYSSILNHREVLSVRYRESVFFILMTTFEVFLIYSFSLTIKTRTDGIKIIIMLVGFLFFDIFVTYFLRKVAEAYKYKYELSLSQRQSEIQLMHYQEMSKKYQESSKIIHDIKKHLATLEALKYKSDESAGKYGELIKKEIDKLYCGFQCTNQILSVVLSQKIDAAESENIKIILQVEDVLFDFIDDLDMTAIFANLWDNAIEACLKVEKDKRYIKFLIQRINDYVFINMENSFNNHILQNDQRLISTKKDHEGIGISSIEAAVEKYDGVFLITPSNGVFNVEISMPILEKIIINDGAE